MRHGLHNPAKFLGRQPFFQDERSREIQRPRAAHRQIVDGAIDRQPSDVAAGKEHRRNDESIRGECQT